MRMWNLSILSILFLSGTVSGGNLAVTFFQTPATTKKPPVQPAATQEGKGGQVQPQGQKPPSGVLGMPGSPPGTTREQFLQNLRQADAEADKAAPGQQPQSPAVRETDSAGMMLRNASIIEVIDNIMAELGYSYVIDPRVTGTVNVFSRGGIPKERLFKVLEQLLRMNNAAIVKEDDFYMIVPINESPKVPHKILLKPSGSKPPAGPEEESTTAETESGRPPAAGAATAQAEGGASEQTAVQQTEAAQAANPAASQPPAAMTPASMQIPESEAARQLEEEQGVITYIIPLNYVPSSQMLLMAQAFLSGGAQVVDFAPSNMLLITDFRQNIQQVLNLVEILDTEYFSINTIDLIPIRFNNASAVAEDLGAVFAPGDTAAGVRLVAIERLNSVLVVTRTPEAFQEVAKWVAKLDAPASTSNIKTYVYQVRNNTAVQIAQILAELYADGSGLPSSTTESETEAAQGQTRPGTLQQTPTRQPGFVPGSQLNQQGGIGRLGATGQGSNQQLGSLGPSLSSAPSQIRSISAGNLKIVVNEFNNSLILQGVEADINFILQTVEQLDTLPRQVLIEAKIYSVELQDDLSFGVNAFLQSRGTGLPGSEGEAGPPTVASVGGETGGQLTIATRAFIGSERELQAIISALRAKTNVEVLEAPRLLALDGVPASLNIGAEVPVTSASFGNPLTAGNTNFVNSINFRSTGTTLQVIPRISASGVVQMEVALEVSSPSGPPLTPTINRNFLTTSLLIQDGQTAGIAGLISDSLNVGRNRVPVLGDIPILGALFGQTTRNQRRSELIIFITPRVINSLPTAAELTLDFKRALRNAYDFIEKMEEEEDELVKKRREEELKKKPPRN